MFWVKRVTIDNNRLTELSEDISLMQGLETFWFGMNQIERCIYKLGSTGTVNMLTAWVCGGALFAGCRSISASSAA